MKQQETLNAQIMIPGLEYTANYISEQQEEQIIELIDGS
jgi:hypothetical protein